MQKNSILILGGYGNTGKALARLLLQETDAQLVLAGRNIGKAQQFADELNKTVGVNRVCGIFADASDSASLRKAFTGMGIVVMASSTTQNCRQVAEIALEARSGYLDIQYSNQKIALLKSMAAEI